MEVTIVNEKIFEERIVHITQIENERARKDVMKRAYAKGAEYFKNWKRYVKVTYVTASPPKIKSIEPIEGTIKEFIQSVESEVGSANVF